MRMTSALNNVGATLLSFCLLLLTPAVNLKGICDNASPKVQTTCNDLITYLTGHADDQLNSVSGEATSFQGFNDDSRDSVDKLITDYFREKARQQLKPDAILSRRRRGNGYIRFGRSAQSSLPSNLFDSFGTSAHGGSHGGRYARSVPSDEPSSNAAANPREKRFMRFGKKSGKLSEENSAEKRFMRFGKKAESLHGKRFMRFGKKNGKQDLATIDMSSLNDNNVDQAAEKRFMRFGKKDLSGNDSPDQPQKRFMRFGKREDEYENENSRVQALADNDLREAEKRFMRFGKRSDEILSPEKRFMRFGKRTGSDNFDAGKRFMRFGKRFMRFGRSGMENALDADKRFMRFGKKWLPQKRFMRFGKRDQELVDGAFT